MRFTSSVIVAASSFTPRISTDWLRTVIAALEQHVHRPLGDLGDLVGRVEVRVEHHVLAELAAVVDDAAQRVDPGVIGEHLHRHHRRAFGRKAHAAHVRDRQQRVADQRDVLGRQLVDVAAGDDDVFELGTRGDVVEGLFPLLGRLRQRSLVDRFGIGADRVRARAETAVDRARLQRQEERLVDVAVGQALHRRVVLLVQRVERQPRMIGQQLRRDRDELPADRILVRPRPVDARDHVRRDAHRHRRAAETFLGVLEEGRVDDLADRLEQLVGRLDRVAPLPDVIEERRLVDVLVGRHRAPELAAAQVAMLQLGRIDRRV